MNSVKKISLCRQQRQLKMGWVRQMRESLLYRLEDHIATCPKCQKRLVKVQRAETALKLLMTQPLAPDLLQKANASALQVLKKDLRDTAPAEALRNVQVRPDWTNRHRRVLETAFSAAACLAVLVLLRTGVFSSMNEIEDDGRAIVQNYYAKHLDSDLMEEIFRSPDKA